MKVTVFGASGGIGKFIIKEALEKGYKVNAYVRNNSKLSINHDNLNVIEGELNNYNTILQAIEGSHAVISALGPSLKMNAKGFPILEAHKNIVKAMQNLNITRFITLATPSVKFEKDSKSLATIIPIVAAKIGLPRAYKEIVGIGDVVKDSNLNWTIVRIIAPVDDNTGVAKVSFGDTKIKFKISREEIAKFMLEQLEDSKYIKSMPIIGV